MRADARSLVELVAQAEELADRFEAYEPEETGRGEPAVMARRRAAYRRVLGERGVADAVHQAPSARVSRR